MSQTDKLYFSSTGPCKKKNAKSRCIYYNTSPGPRRTSISVLSFSSYKRSYLYAHNVCFIFPVSGCRFIVANYVYPNFTWLLMSRGRWRWCIHGVCVHSYK
ncbi:hypothetical protein AG1IA_03881 [Rhizoctonia solani AG-1 IA]|uniref:Uncharacterized protein n=1 Tax=Thanatephorus cucumeris (strain AG1-IA) TaxID=983506 RepID=L8WZ81_THACA|nr:hypothetical protein AG1IA_03881 [Rhizoctonia solani AG-1 IA]